MNLDSGVVTIEKPAFAEADGLKPTKTWTTAGTYCYGERTVGAVRFYNALQADTEVSMLIRIPRTYEVTTACRAKIAPYSHQDSGVPFRIVQVQQLEDEDGLPCTDLSLERMDGAHAG